MYWEEDGWYVGKEECKGGRNVWKRRDLEQREREVSRKEWKTVIGKDIKVRRKGKVRWKS